MTQFCIGTAGNELATKVRFLPADSSSIIAGYTYDIVAGAVANAQALVMKVSSTGTIEWQKTFGVPGSNNLIQDMIITNDGNVVVVGTVGRSSVYTNNRAAILKFNSTSGNLMWQTCFRATPATAAGELFSGVTELGDGRLVAVGAVNSAPTTANALICVFQSNGTLLYNDVYSYGNTDFFMGAATSADGSSVYITGSYIGNYNDIRVMNYLPGVTSGTITWEKYFDFSINGDLQNNFVNEVYVSGSQIIINGSCLHNYTYTGGLGHYVLTMNAADGSSPLLKTITNSGTSYSNVGRIAVASADHIYAVQSPHTAYYDPSIWTSGISTSTVVSEITSLTAETANTPIRFTSADVGFHSIYDLALHSSYLDMAGVTNVTSGFGDNDIYFVLTSAGLSSDNLSCDTVHDVIAIGDTPLVATNPTFTHSTITVAYVTVDTAIPDLGIRVLCGDLALPDAGCNVLTMPDTLTTCAAANTVMPATVAGSDSVFSYLWSPSTGLSSTTVRNPTLTASTSGWYHQTVTSQMPTNFVTNGDFTAGNTGFTTGYTPGVPAIVSTPGTYAVTNSPSLYDATFIPFGDHTTGVGNMLLIDGSPVPGTSFWCQTIPVTPNTDYVFGGWVTLAHLPLPSVQISINGIPSGTFAPTAIVGTWAKFGVAWNSGINTSVTICMEDLNTGAFGNDFAIDDIFLQQTCVSSDSTYVNVITPDTTSIATDTTVCFAPGNSATITAPAGYTSYTWNVGGTTSTLVVSSGTYWVYATIGCSTIIDTFHVIVLNDTFNLYNVDTAICRGQIVQARITGNTTWSYQWRPTAGIRFPNILNPQIEPDTSAMYTLTASIAGCPDVVDSFFIDVQPVPQVFAGGSRTVCEFDTLHVNATVTPAWYTKYIYNWTPATYLDDPAMPTVVFKAGDTTSLILTVTTPIGCQGVDSARIIVFPGNFAAFDTSVSLCPGDSVQFMPVGGLSYRWTPGMYLDDSTSASPWVHPITSLQYRVIASEIHGCTDTMWADITVRPNAVITTGDSVTIHHGESYQLNPETNCSSFLWFPAAGLDNRYVSNPVATPDADTRYIVQGTTQWGCKTVDTFVIYVGATELAVPNAFAPGNGGKFSIVKKGTATLRFFRVYDRWGKMVFETTNINEGWDGTFNGKPQPIGVYVYQVEAYTNTGVSFEKHGNVTLIR